MSAVVQDREPWVHRQFLKDKLRVRERYWRRIQDDDATSARVLVDNTNENPTIIPDGFVWRKYLPLLTLLIKEGSFQFVLLESAVELMDWRNVSPCIPIIPSDEDEPNNKGITSDEHLQPESTALYERNRMRKLLQNHPQHVILWCDLSIRDEDCDEWDVLSYAEMSITDRSRHALVRAGRLWKKHSVILLVYDESSDLANDAGHCEGVSVHNMDSFMDFLAERLGPTPNDEMQNLFQLKMLCEDTYVRRNNPRRKNDGMCTEVPSAQQIQEGIRQGRLFTGRMEVSKANVKEAYVRPSRGLRYFIDGQMGYFQHALHQDMVVIEPLPESEWGRPVGRRRLVYHSSRTDDDDEESKLSDDTGPPVPSARVVAISNPSRRTFVATMVDQPVGDERAILVVPMDIRIPKIRVRTRDWKKFVNQRLLIHVDEWEEGANYPSGHFVTSLGTIGDLETEISCLLHEHEIQLEPFSASALASLPPEGSAWTIPENEIETRRDLRHSHRIFSVDPPGCQDIDDTMHARVMPNGDIEFGVHIADVTYFVPHNSALDREAQVRGTTFYLVDRRFDMLPSLLSSDLCSLHGNKDRLAVSVIWTLSPDFETIRSCWYGRTVIHNCQAMTYEQADNILHGRPPDDPSAPSPPPLTAGAPVEPSLIKGLKADLMILQKLARKLRRDREDIGGAVDLSSGDLGSELKFELDENGNPTKVAPKQEKEIHHTIAEMMIFANRYVAQKVYESFPESSLLRIHRAVEESRFEDLENALKAGGIMFDGSSNMALAHSLNDAKQAGKDGSVVNSLWQSLATRAMSEALYICTGHSKDGSNFSHYGLGIDKYTHFTSPIRRYADVVVHKQLLAALVREKSVASRKGSDYDLAVSRPALPSLPDSQTISVLQGERRAGDMQTGVEEIGVDPDEMLDALIEGAEELALGVGVNKTLERQATREEIADQIVPYGGADVELICDGLNRQNRMAKRSSMECQNLFLSLYFRDHAEVTHAVVTDARINGLLVYVPKFDLKGPVYLSDKDGDVQIDPALVGLPADAGCDPTLGFSTAPGYRRFASGRCELKETSDEGRRLEISIPGSSAAVVFRILDVVTVQLSSDFSDVKSRIPPARIHLVAAASAKTGRAGRSKPGKVVSSMIGGGGENRIQSASSRQGLASRSPVKSSSLYEQLASIRIQPVLADVPFRKRVPRSDNDSVPNHTKHAAMPGRRVFSEFVNPDTRLATQEAAQSAASEAAAQRRSQAIAHQSHRDEYDTSRNVERSATARMQRIAADKRNTRRSKAK